MLIADLTTSDPEGLSMKSDPVSNSVERETSADVLTAAAMAASELRRDLDDAWTNRQNAVNGDSVFARLAEKSREAQGK